jgi:hypothetical protein
MFQMPILNVRNARGLEPRRFLPGASNLFAIWSLVLGAWAATVASAAPGASATAEVRLRSTAGCSAAVVRLADVAEIHTDDVRLGEALAEIPLCPAPTGGSTRSLSQHDVRQLLALSGVEKKTAQVTGSAAVAISAQGTRPLAQGRPLLVASGVRQAAFAVDAAGDQTKEPASLPPAPFSPPVPKPSEPAALIERGSSVTIKAQTAGVRITTSGKALDAGAAGETIGVELFDTKQRVLARVIGPQLVEVAVGNRSVATPAEAAAVTSQR